MLRILFFAFAISRCYADLSITTLPPVLCGEIPSALLDCIGSPKILPSSIMGQCYNSSECEKYTCAFRKSNWMDGDKINKQKVSAHFEQFAKDNPTWATAVQQLKTACLSSDLPALGVHLNCPAYDISICNLNAFIRKVPPSQWSQSSQCRYPRQYAASCPLCPNDCFAPQVPYGSCNACLYIPRITPVPELARS